MQDQVIQLVQNVGFPIAMSVYLLVKMENKIDQLADSIKSLTRAIETSLARN
ncbi:MAG: YvrJ family protein [Peptostreptococcus anaerobius]